MESPISSADVIGASCARQTAKTGAQIVVDSILKAGVEVAFGLPGGAVIPLYDAIFEKRNQLRHVLVRHEQAAVHAADGYARASGKTGVAIATSGPGATNLVTGLVNAYLDSIPLVVIGGQVPTSSIGTDAFQECDMVGLSSPITKHNFQPRNPQDVAAMVNRAFYIAQSERPGPVYLDLPKDLQLAKVTPEPHSALDQSCNKSDKVDPHSIARIQMLLHSAKRPLLLCGHGALLAGAGSALSQLARQFSIPVTSTILAKGLIDEKHELSLGCIGMHGQRLANYALAHCDVLLAFGCRFSDRATGDPSTFAHGKHIVHVDIDAAEIGKSIPVQIGLQADARQVALALLNSLELKTIHWSGWTAQVHRLQKRCKRDCRSSKKTLCAQGAMQALDRVLEADDIVCTGVGQHQMLATHFLTRSAPRTFLTSGGAGTMGYGLPAAIGAALAKPDKRVWLVDGDGSFQMTLQELVTATQSGANIRILVFDNRYLGMVRQWQELYCESRYSSVDLSNNPDFVKIAHAYGIQARSVRNAQELQPALEQAKATAETTLIHIMVDRESNVLPMIPAGGGLRDFVGHCVTQPGQFFSAQELHDKGPDHER